MLTAWLDQTESIPLLDLFILEINLEALQIQPTQSIL